MLVIIELMLHFKLFRINYGETTGYIKYVNVFREIIEIFVLVTQKRKLKKSMYSSSADFLVLLK